MKYKTETSQSIVETSRDRSVEGGITQPMRGSQAEALAIDTNNALNNWGMTDGERIAWFAHQFVILQPDLATTEDFTPAGITEEVRAQIGL